MVTRNLSFSSDEFYHIYNRGVEKIDIFRNDTDKNRFQKLLYLCNDTQRLDFKEINPDFHFETKREETLTDIGAHCLMSTHFHLLFHEKKTGGISLFMQKLITAYSMYFNKKYKRTGRFFEGPFRAKHLDRDTYLNYIFAYIHLNPTSFLEPGWKEVGIKNIRSVKDFLKNYKFSSYSDYLNIKRPEGRILNKEAFPDYFSENKDFNDLIEDWLKISNEISADLRPY